MWKKMNDSKTLVLLCLSLAVLILGQSDAFAQFILSGELRPRTEFRHGYATLADASSGTAIFTSQRSRLNFLVNHEKYRVGLSIQDVRVWGDEEQLRDIASVAAHEAWGEIKFHPYLGLKLGRQELVYDDHRLLGSVNWVQQARSHDAALLKFRKKDWQVDFAAAYNNENPELFRSRYTLVNYRSLFFLWINKSLNKSLKISAIGIADGFQAADTTTDDIVYRYTFGSHLQFKKQNLGLNGTFYYQSGKNRSRTALNAYMFALKGMYQHKRLSLNAGIDFLSGTNALDTGNSEINTFNTLYATNHKFYGYMDYFLNIPLQTANGGLADIFAGIKYRMAKKTALSVEYHNFRLANNVADPADPGIAIDKGLGSEIDAVVNYNFHPDLNIKAGYSVMFPTASMEVLKGGDKDVSQYWAWLMITFKPEFFKIDLPE
jgi:hypothetical protein